MDRCLQAHIHVGAGIWRLEDLEQMRTIDRIFQPSDTDVAAAYAQWQDAVSRCRGWAGD